MTRALALTLLALLVSCASDEKTDAPSTAPRGPRSAARAPDEQAPAAPSAPPATTPAPFAPMPAAQPAEQEPAQEKPAEKEERDYGAELRAAIGSPADCVKPRPGSEAQKIRIEIDATVMETGFVSRAYASAPQLAADELECVKRRLSSLRMRAPVEDAPRSVRATIELELRPAPAKPDGGRAASAYGSEPAAPQTADAPAAPAEQPAAVPGATRESPEESGP